MNEKLFNLGLALMIVGIAIMILAPLTILAMNTSAKSVNVTGGGCIVIFFVPICFGVGSSPLMGLVIALALSLTLIAVVFFLFTYLSRKYRASAWI